VYELSGIVLINWYLFQAEEVELEGTVGIIGATGAGKSSVLDAMQVVLFGNNSQWYRLNETAQRRRSAKNRRTVKGYCLGQITDVEGGGVPVRASSHTHLALNFSRKDVKGDQVAIGVSLYADKEHDGEKVDLRSMWLVEGGVSKNDFVRENTDSNGRKTLQTLTWEDVLGSLKSEQRLVDVESKSAKQFTKKYLYRLCHDPEIGYRPDYDRYRRTLGMAVRADAPENASEFIRNYILDPQPLGLQRLRGQWEFWKQLREELLKINERMDAISRLRTTSGKIRELEEKRAELSYFQDYLTAAVEREKLRNCKQAFMAADRAKTQADAEVIRLENMQVDVRERRDAIQAQILASDESTRLLLAENDLKTARSWLDKCRNELEQHRVQLTDICSLVQDMPVIQALLQRDDLMVEDVDLAAALSALARVIGQNIPIDTWPADLGAITKRLGPLKHLGSLSREVHETYRQAIGTEKSLDIARRDLQEQIASVRERKSALSSQELAFLEEFLAAGFDTKPLCSLCDITDETWRQTIEVILGGKRAALVIPEQQLEPATRMYRHLRSQFKGHRLINARRLNKNIGAPPAGSLAELVVTDDPIARAYINRELGSIQRVETESELKQAKRAATQDMMFNDGATILRLNAERYYPKMARSDIDRKLLPDLEAKAEKVEAERVEANKLERLLENFYKSVDAASIRINADFSSSLQKARLDYDVAKQALIDAEENVKAANDALNPQLRKLKEDLSQELDLINQDLDGKPQLGTTKADYDNKDSDAWGWRTRRDARSERRGNMQGRLLSQQASYNKCYAVWRETLNVYQISPFSMRHKLVVYRSQFMTRQDAIDQAKIDKELVELRIPDLHQSVISGLVNYNNENNIILDFEPSHRDLSSIDKHLFREWDNLNENVLREHEEKIKDTQESIRDIIANDFAGSLFDGLRSIPNKIEEINLQLKNRWFNKERYYFRYSFRPNYKKFIELAQMMKPGQGSLDFTSAEVSLDDVSPSRSKTIAQAIDEVMDIIGEEDEDISDYEDVRNYYYYELEFRNSEDKPVATYTSRQGIGSGGEGAAPFYIVIAASLAAIYHGSHNAGRRKNGMGLVLYDEAFDSLDRANTIKVMNYLRDIGLQPVVAAPDKVKGTMTASTNTFVKVRTQKERGISRLEADYVGDRARKTLLAEDPALQTREEFAARLSKQEDVVQ
jgi:energy-coupling factor transporter ATP-binding protein EcfA2